MAEQSTRSRKKGASIQGYLESLSSADLVSYVLELARRTPQIKRDLEQRAVLAGADAGELLHETRKELRKLASEKHWNDWEDRYDDFDYRHLRSLFERLLAARQADALLDLGRELLEKAREHLKYSEADEPDKNLLACFTAVFKAVPDSSRPDVDKMLYLIDLSLADEDDLTDGMNDLFERDWPTAVWSAVADEMTRRLERGGSHKRDELTHWLHQALEASGRDDEVLPLLEREAAASGNYLHLVDTLIAEKRWDDARRWILEGLQKKNVNPSWSAGTLRDRWSSIAGHQKDWATLAAVAADVFFSQPHTGTFREMIKAAKKAHCEEAVRAAALRFLETGIRPEGKSQPTARSPSARANAKTTSAAWPLPALPAVLLQEARYEYADAPGPRYDVLLKLAIEEKRPEEVLRWYERLNKAKKGTSPWHYGWHDYRSQVADAVAESHPERAEALYRDLIAGHLAHTHVSAYESAEPYLVKLKALLTRNRRTAEWAKYLKDLRETHFRKPRLMEVLDRVEGGRSRR